MTLQQLELKQNKLVFDADAILKLAAEEKRGLTDTEVKTYDDLIEKQLPNLAAQIKNLKRADEQREAIKRFTPQAVDAFNNLAGVKSLGQQFTESDAWKWLTDTKSQRSGSWRSPSVELKTVLTEDPASGGGIVIPQFVPGIIPSPTRPIVMSELFSQGTATSNSVVYMEETLYDLKAAPVLEATLKPESGLTFAAKSAPVRKIAHYLPVSDEMLEDIGQMQSYINARLQLGVMLTLDNQLLHGSGTAPELLGLLLRGDVTPPLAVVAPTTAMDAIAQQISAVEQASQLAVDGIVLNPADWLKLALTKDTLGDYVGANPFAAPQTPTLWGRSVAQTITMPAGTCLVGSFKSGGAQLFTRGGMRVEASNSHQDWFVKNLVAILAEIRVALAIYRPVAFGLITGI